MRSANRQRLEKIYRTVEENPGVKPGKVARQMGVPRSSVTRALPALEEQGLLLSQDGRGGLWPWGRRK